MMDQQNVNELYERLGGAWSKSAKTRQEQHWSTRVLAQTLSTLAPRVQLPTDPSSLEAFNCFRRIATQGRNARVTHQLQVPWLAPFWERLIAEAEAQRGSPRFYRECAAGYAPCGITAAELSDDDAFMGWVRASTGVADPGSKVRMSYIYYENEGDHCRIHVDTPMVADYNCLIGLRHHRPEGQASTFRVFDEEGTHDYEIEPKSAVVFDGPHTVHARTPLSKGERVVLLSIFFREPD